jgi:hypothetical protein
MMGIETLLEAAKFIQFQEEVEGRGKYIQLLTYIYWYIFIDEETYFAFAYGFIIQLRLREHHIHS